MQYKDIFCKKKKTKNIYKEIIHYIIMLTIINDIIIIKHNVMYYNVFNTL